MMEIKWEYCILEYMRFNIEMNQKKENGDLAEQLMAVVGVRFCGADGVVLSKVLKNITTSNREETKQEFFFGRVLGLLGERGWELTSLMEQPDHWDVCTTMSAYLKRPMLEGRALDEPTIDAL